VSTQSEKIDEALKAVSKVALYMNMEHGYFSVQEVRYSNLDKHYQPLPEGELREHPFLDGYVRVSDPVAVTFQKTDASEIVARAVESIEETERKLMVETEQKLGELREKKKQLLSIIHQPEVA
jgi:hypothetical protein